MDGVTLGDGVHVQNSVLCAGAGAQDGAARMEAWRMAAGRG
jgi:hypothetical protein